MKKDKVLQILVRIALFLGLPIILSIIVGVLYDGIFTGILALGLCALLEALIMWGLYANEREFKEKMKAWKEEGLSDMEIEKRLLGERRERLEDRLDMTYMCAGRGGHSDMDERFAIKEELHDVEERLNRLDKYRD